MKATRGRTIKEEVIMIKTMEPKEFPSTSMEAPKIKLDGVQMAAPHRVTKLRIVQCRWSSVTGAK